MLESIVTEKVVTEIRITRDFEFYFYSRKENGQTAILAQRITQARAKEIIESFPGQGRTIGHEPVDWTPGARQFTWVVTVGEGEDDH